MNYLKIIYYVIVVLSFLLYILSAQFKEKKDILTLQIFSSICYFTAYLITGMYSGAATKLIETLKDLIFIKKEKNNEKIPLQYLILFLILLIIVAVIYYDTPWSLLPLFINILLFISTYFKNPQIIRYVMFFTGILWGIYNISGGLYLMCIGNVFEIISALISALRYQKKA